MRGLETISFSFLFLQVRLKSSRDVKLLAQVTRIGSDRVCTRDTPHLSIERDWNVIYVILLSSAEAFSEICGHI